MKKRFVHALLLLMMFSVALAGCGSSSTPAKEESSPATTETKNEEQPKEKVKLSLWHNFTGEDLRAKAMRGIIDQFQKDHANVQLDIQAIPPDGYRQRLKTVAAANELPDVFIMHPGTIAKEFSSAGLVQPLNDLLDSNPAWKDGYLPNSFDDFTFDGKTYSAPMGLSPTSILYYNKTILTENGLTVPKTWDELLNAVKVLKEKNIIPIALGNKAPWLAQSSILSSLADRVTGTEWFDKAVAQDGAKFTDPEFVQALTYLQQLGTTGAFQEGFNAIDTTQMEQLYAQGKAAMIIEGGWAVTNLVATAPKDVLAATGVAVLPSIPNGKGDPNSVSGATGVGPALSSKVEGAKKDIANQLILALAGPEAQKTTLEANQLVSFKVDLDKSKVEPLFADLYSLVNSVKRTPVYDSKLTSAATETVNNGLQELLLGAKPEEIAKKIQDAQEQGLKE
ncbi:ABC transporter substrate-binding protein [Paenibacillus selenitireducens]|uniref:ABC transporter substrate-binding protein n=1 Tax=Paenibacillus selenitireducens TaxID=1324314 RepID=A0A1T2XMU4_9BACL|nr:extracellular solute-binding protein [Paenibacillus selenitireducens]OPA81056.1 ABC transporter substrate-binding protein [Paenibacillus selenitireducens]